MPMYSYFHVIQFNSVHILAQAVTNSRYLFGSKYQLKRKIESAKTPGHPGHKGTAGRR